MIEFEGPEDSEPSLAVRVFEPEVLRVSAKEPTPFVSVAEVGKTAAPSLEAMATVPEYPVAVLPLASLAVTVKLKDEPAVVDAGTEESTS